MKLRFRGPDGQTLEVPVTSAFTTVGRTEDNDVSLADRTVSRNHCRIFRDGEGRVLVEDTGSRYGTYVNNARVATPAPFKPGDVLRVGEFTAELFDETLVDKAGAPAAAEPSTPRGMPAAPVQKATLAIKRSAVAVRERRGYRVILWLAAAAGLLALGWLLLLGGGQ